MAAHRILSSLWQMSQQCPSTGPISLVHSEYFCTAHTSHHLQQQLPFETYPYHHMSSTCPPDILHMSSKRPPHITHIHMSKDRLDGTIRVTCGQDTGDWLSTIYSELSQLTLQDSRMWEQEPICLGPAEVVLLMHGSNLRPGKVHTPHCWLTLILPTLCRGR